MTLTFQPIRVATGFDEEGRFCRKPGGETRKDKRSVVRSGGKQLELRCE
jgi:hypothetical protein